MKVYFISAYNRAGKMVYIKTNRAKNLDTLRKRLMKEFNLNSYWFKIAQNGGTVDTAGELYLQWGRPVWKSYRTHGKYTVMPDGRLGGEID